MPNPRSIALHRALVFLTLALLAASVGCDDGSSDGDDGTRSPADEEAGDSDHAPLPAIPPGTMGTGAPASGSDFGSGAAGTGGAGLPTGASDGESEGADRGGEGPGSGEADAGAPDPIEVEPGQLTAGEWSDLENWSFWRELHGGAECDDEQQCPDGAGGEVAAEWSTYWGFDTQGRIAVHVSSGGDPVIDAAVELRDEDGAAVYSARTDSHGRAELFAGLFAASSGEHTIAVEAGGETVEQIAAAPSAEPIEVEFPVAHAPPPSLDLMFMVDTTGSMDDELSYIQAELGHVIEQVRDEIGSQLSVRLSVNFYRDRGDEYLVRDFGFTSEIGSALDQLAAQSAGGGGDTPEAVEEALDNAVNDHAWSEAATARLLFFVLDAPPHYDQGRLQSLHESALAAAHKGVQIIPLAASGVDAQTEFLLRLLAIASNGSYTFLTDDSGIGNSHLAPTIGPYDVELLDDLLVRVIRERL